MVNSMEKKMVTPIIPAALAINEVDSLSVKYLWDIRQIIVSRIL